MAGTSVLDATLTFAFLRKLTKKFENWQAFKTGVIDKDGNIIVPPSERSFEQKNSFKTHDLMVLKIKKLLAKLPGGSSSIATFAAALYLITEKSEEFDEEKFTNFITEEMNSTAGMAGREDTSFFSGHKVFDVDFEAMHKSRFGKKPYARYKAYVGEDEVGEEIRKYSRENPKKSVIIRNKKTGEMVFLRKK